MRPRSLAIVLPAYNEATRLGPALDELFGYLRRRRSQALEGVAGVPWLPDTIDVLVVDDGSTDGTASLVLGRPERDGDEVSGATLRLLSVPHGGKGAAVRAGVLDATAEAILFADADMATPPDQLPLLVGALEHADVALGSRIQPDGSDMRTSQPAYRRFLGRVFHVIASAWVVGPVKDTQCGFKAFRREVGRELFGRQRVTSIVFDVELIFLARRLDYRIKVVPIRWSDRRGSRMRPSPGIAIRVAWDLFRIPLIHREVRRVPVRRPVEHERPRPDRSP